MRIHVGFAVRDLEAAAAFYETLLGEPPVKTRPGYAKWEPEDPSVNLSIHVSNDPRDPAERAPETHYGVQVASTEAVLAAERRLRDAGYATKLERESVCCYAEQDKVWATDPDGRPWEVFFVRDADVAYDRDPVAAGDMCCDPGCCAETGERGT